jgi:hypothetical protein
MTEGRVALLATVAMTDAAVALLATVRTIAGGAPAAF